MKQLTPFPFVGSTDKFTFYQSRYGNIVARKNDKITKKRIDNEPRFATTKANYQEFSHIMKSAALIRRSFRHLLRYAKDGDTGTRMTSIMFRIIKADEVNKPGERNISKGLIERLDGFEFNGTCRVADAVFAPYTVDIDHSSGEVRLNMDSFKPKNALHSPKGATHFRLSMCAAELDFENRVEEHLEATTIELPVSKEYVPAIQLSVVLKPGSPQIIMVALGLEFFEKEGPALNLLKPSALAIVKISKP